MSFPQQPRSLFSTAARPSRSQRADQAVRETDTDAAQARCSAASLGYIDEWVLTVWIGISSTSSDQLTRPAPCWTSPFARLLLRDALAPRRPPWVNIGTHHRTHILDILIQHFLNSPSTAPKQVLSLGAGSDSRFWRLRNCLTPWPTARWVETDFPESTATKAGSIVRHEPLRKLCGEDVQVAGAGECPLRALELRLIIHESWHRS